VTRAELGSSRAFWLFWTASAVSLTGDAITTIALPLTAITVLHASSLQVSLLTAASFTSWLVIGLPAGAIVHRWPLRRVQVAADLFRAVVLVSVPAAAWLDVLSLPQLVLVTLVSGFASVLFDVANSTFMVSVVPREDLTRRNSLTSATVAVTQTAGPSFGGLLVGVAGAANALLVDVASFLASGALLARVPRTEARTDHGLPVRKAVIDGWRYVVRHPVIGPCAAMATTINFVCGALIALGPLYLVRTLHAPVRIVGVVLAAEGVGTFLGAALTSRLAGRVGSARLLVRATAFGGVCALLMPLASRGVGLLLFAVGYAGFAAGVVVLSILARTNRQEEAPPELLPRVMATVRFVSWGVVPVGALLAGGLADVFSVRFAVAAFCLLSLAVPAIGLLSAPIRSRRELASIPADG
jgi:MFS family permease